MKRKASGNAASAKPNKFSKKDSEDKQLAVIQWLRHNYFLGNGGSTAKAQLFDEYINMCSQHSIEPTSNSAFGKLVRTAFPGVQSSRKGPRGAAKHQYKNLLRRTGLHSAETGRVYDCVEEVDEDEESGLSGGEFGCGEEEESEEVEEESEEVEDADQSTLSPTPSPATSSPQLSSPSLSSYPNSAHHSTQFVPVLNNSDAVTYIDSEAARTTFYFTQEDWSSSSSSLSMPTEDMSSPTLSFSYSSSTSSSPLSTSSLSSSPPPVFATPAAIECACCSGAPTASYEPHLPYYALAEAGYVGSEGDGEVNADAAWPTYLLVPGPDHAPFQAYFGMAPTPIVDVRRDEHSMWSTTTTSSSGATEDTLSVGSDSSACEAWVDELLY